MRLGAAADINVSATPLTARTVREVAKWLSLFVCSFPTNGAVPARARLTRYALTTGPGFVAGHKQDGLPPGVKGKGDPPDAISCIKTKLLHVGIQLCQPDMAPNCF